MSFDNNDPSIYAGMHHPVTTMAHQTMFQQNNMGLGWSPGMNPSGMDIGTTVPSSSPASLPSPPSGIDKSNTSNINYTKSGNPTSANSRSTSTDAASNATSSAPLDLSKPYHSEWGVMKEQDFHPLTLKHQRDLENIYNTGNVISDFYFWQANLGGYCMADMIQNIVVSSEGAFPLVRRLVGGAPHPGRRKKKRTPA